MSSLAGRIKAKCYLKNSLIIHEEKTKEITAVSVVSLYVIKIMIIYINFISDKALLLVF
jgi:hypothetical protein